MKKSLSILAMAEAMAASVTSWGREQIHVFNANRQAAKRNDQLEAETIRKAESKRLRKQQKRLAHAS